jgi:hypothetical protein
VIFDEDGIRPARLLGNLRQRGFGVNALAALPSDDLLRESAYVVARGVRVLALVGVCDAAQECELESRLAVLAGRTVPFIIPDASSRLFGFASAPWAIDLFC